MHSLTGTALRKSRFVFLLGLLLISFEVKLIRQGALLIKNRPTVHQDYPGKRLGHQLGTATFFRMPIFTGRYSPLPNFLRLYRDTVRLSQHARSGFYPDFTLRQSSWGQSRFRCQ